jgi:uncharacterized protein (DUF2062 family)
MKRSPRPSADVPKRLRHYLPTPEAVLAKRWCAPFRPLLGHPSLWHLNRRSVPGAMAIGLFCGLIPGPFQMLSALLLSIPLRKNIPLALAVTFYTNPFTIVPLYVIAFGYGQLLIGDDGEPHHLTPDAWDPSGIWHWMLDLGKPLGVGLVALALTLALVGYIATAFAWRMQVVRAWEKRTRARAAGLRAARTPAPPAPRDPGRG